MPAAGSVVLAVHSERADMPLRPVSLSASPPMPRLAVLPTGSISDDPRRAVDENECLRFESFDTKDKSADTLSEELIMAEGRKASRNRRRGAPSEIPPTQVLPLPGRPLTGVVFNA
mmetsp:Transcript_83601/g.270177  ORF Transcript_83601/g.270177 Transcript_83601/m.270177 type:complete len:116 (-) Transcript_83601:397-744(-)